MFDRVTLGTHDAKRRFLRGRDAGVASREQVRELLDRGLNYETVGRRLGIPPGQAYLIATGRAAGFCYNPRPKISRPLGFPGGIFTALTEEI